MGIWVNLFQASTRFARTGNLRGMLSSGSASSPVMRTAELAAAFRRKGSRKTRKPATTGTTPSNPPMIVAKKLLKKLRRPTGGDALHGSFIINETLEIKKMFRENANPV